jgi:hypothetical protein
MFAGVQDCFHHIKISAHTKMFCCHIFHTWSWERTRSCLIPTGDRNIVVFKMVWVVPMSPSVTVTGCATPYKWVWWPWYLWSHVRYRGGKRCYWSWASKLLTDVYTNNFGGCVQDDGSEKHTLYDLQNSQFCNPSTFGKNRNNTSSAPQRLLSNC